MKEERIEHGRNVAEQLIVDTPPERLVGFPRQEPEKEVRLAKNVAMQERVAEECVAVPLDQCRPTLSSGSAATMDGQRCSLHRRRPLDGEHVEDRRRDIDERREPAPAGGGGSEEARLDVGRPDGRDRQGRLVRGMQRPVDDDGVTTEVDVREEPPEHGVRLGKRVLPQTVPLLGGDQRPVLVRPNEIGCLDQDHRALTPCGLECPVDGIG